MAAEFSPSIVVEARSAIKEHAIRGAAPAHHLAGLDEGCLVSHIRVWKGEKIPSRNGIRAWGDPVGRRVKDPRCELDVTILDHKQGFYRSQPRRVNTEYGDDGTYSRGTPWLDGRRR